MAIKQPGALVLGLALGREPVGQAVEAVLLLPERDAVHAVVLGRQQLAAIRPARAYLMRAGRPETGPGGSQGLPSSA